MVEVLWEYFLKKVYEKKLSYDGKSLEGEYLIDWRWFQDEKLKEIRGLLKVLRELKVLRMIFKFNLFNYVGGGVFIGLGNIGKD